MKNVLLFIGWILMIFGTLLIIKTNNLVLMTGYTLLLIVVGAILYDDKEAWWED